MEDTRIIELYWQRNGTAIDETDKKYGQMCHRLANGILGDERDGEECVSDTYMTVWQSIPTQRPVRFQAFLAAITRSHGIDMLRARRAAKRGGGEGECVLDELSECLASGEDVQAAVAARELAAAIDKFLDTLKAADRDMFVCRYWLCAPVAEIARRMGATESRVKSSLMRNRNKLRAYLEEEGYI